MVAETKYGKYFITEPKPNLKYPSFRQEEVDRSDKGQASFLYLDNELLKGAFYVECMWFWPGPGFWPNQLIKAHTHNFDEVLAFFGTNPNDPHDLGGEMEIWLDDEKHTMTKSFMVFIPKGLKHAPVTIKKLDRPILHFSVGPGKMYR
jgi:hypothetical protein